MNRVAIILGVALAVAGACAVKYANDTVKHVRAELRMQAWNGENYNYDTPQGGDYLAAPIAPKYVALAGYAGVVVGAGMLAGAWCARTKNAHPTESGRLTT